MKYFFVVIFSFLIQFANAQSDTLVVEAINTLPKWEQKNKAGLNISEVTFVNWNAGGSNSISALIGLATSLNYTYGLLRWRNEGIINYGINKQEGQKLRKTTDQFELSSTMGFQKDSLSNWYLSARSNFKTQLTNGYHYPNRSNPISKLMAPGYLFIGGGVEYGKHLEKFSTYLSPLTFKSTFVLDKDLSNAGSFGVAPAVVDGDGTIIKQGERVRTEIGILLTNAFETQVFENIAIKNQISFYTDYINSFGNIDVDWEVMFDFKVNQYVKASLGSHLKYDNDVKTLVATNVENEFDKRGAKIQWKQLLGIGVVVDF